MLVLLRAAFQEGKESCVPATQERRPLSLLAHQVKGFKQYNKRTVKVALKPSEEGSCDIQKGKMRFARAAGMARWVWP